MLNDHPVYRRFNCMFAYVNLSTVDETFSCILAVVKCYNAMCVSVFIYTRQQSY